MKEYQEANQGSQGMDQTIKYKKMNLEITLDRKNLNL